MTIYGYARVSTAGQDLPTQIEMLEKNGAEKIFQEKYTGTSNKRPQFKKLLEVIEQGDTLVVTKLDRFARSTIDALNTIQDLFERGIIVNVLNLGKIENTASGRLIFTVFSAFAEFERDLIVERTQEGKEYAKKNNPNYREGRPKRQLTPKYMHAIEVLKNNTYKETERKTGISKSTLQRIKKQYIQESGDLF